MEKWTDWQRYSVIDAIDVIRRGKEECLGTVLSESKRFAAIYLQDADHVDYGGNSKLVIFDREEGLFYSVYDEPVVVPRGVNDVGDGFVVQTKDEEFRFIQVVDGELRNGEATETLKRQAYRKLILERELFWIKGCFALESKQLSSGTEVIRVKINNDSRYTISFDGTYRIEQTEPTDDDWASIDQGSIERQDCERYSGIVFEIPIHHLQEGVYKVILEDVRESVSYSVYRNGEMVSDLEVNELGDIALEFRILDE